MRHIEKFQLAIKRRMWVHGETSVVKHDFHPRAKHDHFQEWFVPKPKKSRFCTKPKESSIGKSINYLWAIGKIESSDHFREFEYFLLGCFWPWNKSIRQLIVLLNDPTWIQYWIVSCHLKVNWIQIHPNHQFATTFESSNFN